MRITGGGRKRIWQADNYREEQENREG